MTEKPGSQQVNRVGAKPVQAGERLEFVDILRGFAVFGILVANMVNFSGQHGGILSWPGWLDRAAVVFTEFFIRAKFYSLFSLLFGWGMAVQMRRAASRGSDFLRVYVRRLFILLVFGVIHGTLIWSGDILATYALFGGLLLLFRNRSNRFILLASALCLAFAIALYLPLPAVESFREWYADLVAPLQSDRYPASLFSSGTYREITLLRVQGFVGLQAAFIYYFGNVFAVFLVGLYIGKRELFQNILKHESLLKRVMWAGLIIGIVFNGFFIATHIWRDTVFPAWIPDGYQSLAIVGSRSIGAPAMMLFYVAAIIRLARDERWYARLAPLAFVGRMALTNYILQSVIGTLIFYNYGLGLYGEFGPAFGLGLTIAIYYAQVRFSAWWFDRYQFGPLEWLWRTLTYGRRQPIRYDQTFQDIRPIPWVERLREVSPSAKLGFAWLVLAVWAVGLAYQYAQLGLFSRDDAETEQELEAGFLQGIDLGQDEGGLLPEEIIPPDVRPATYDPGALAASGNLLGLAETFSVEAALGQIETLTGAPHLGRGAGTQEGYAAGDYIAGQLASFGVQPAGDDGTFFQLFPFEYSNVSANPQFSVEGPDGEIIDHFGFHEDYSSLILGYLGGGSAEGEVVWANACEPRDFAALDAVGKIVFCREGSSYDIGRSAIEHGTAGLLLLADTAARPLDFGPIYREAWVPETIPALRISPEAAASLMRGSGKSVEDLTISFYSFPLETRASFSVPATGNESCVAGGEECQGRNVLGVIPGRDADYADEVVIIGGHYDHLGETPDNTVIWRGANDNASGIAVMLEIARSWQEQGYAPRRTVVFAAWDAEEFGLFGSRYYTRHPRYPLESTAAYINMDMVGAGTETLAVGGAGDFAEYLAAVAEGSGVETEVLDTGGSDHVAFLEAGVPAATMDWWASGGEIPHYHRPADTLEVIEPEKLAAVGRIANLGLLGLTEAEPEIAALIESRQEAIRGGDMQAFLSTSTPEQRPYDQRWFEDLQSLQLTFTEFTVQFDTLRFSGGQAAANVHYSIGDDGAEAETDESDNEAISASVTIRFEHNPSGWRWAGSGLVPAQSGEEQAAAGEGQGISDDDPAAGGVFQEETPDGARAGFAVFLPAGVEEDLSDFGQALSLQYNVAATALGLATNPQVSVLLYPNPQALRADTALSLSSDLASWVEPGRIKLQYLPGIAESEWPESALAQLLLAEAGVTEQAAPWLWRGGLESVLAAREDMAAVQTEFLPGLRAAIEDPDAATPNAAMNWAATDFLQRRLGWGGLGSFIRELGRLCQQGRCEAGGDGLEIALRNSLGYGEERFEEEWRSDWLARLERAQMGLDAVLATRVESVLAGDANGFRQTVDGNAPTLLAEEQAWFADLARYPAEEFSMSARPLVVYPNGDVLASVMGEYQLDGPDTRWAGGAFSSTTLFTNRGGSLRWAGPAFDILSGSGISVYHPAGSEEQAEEILAEAEEIYARAAEMLGVAQVGTITIKLYQTDSDFRSSVFLSYPLADWLPGWTGETQAVKLRLSAGNDEEGYHSILTTYITRQLLYRMGVESEWLLKGVPAYLADSLNNGMMSNAVGSNLHRLLDADSRGELSALAEIPADDELEEAEWGIAIAQSWDLLKYLTVAHGESALPRLLSSHGRGQPIEAAVQFITGQSPEEFESAWVESLGRAHTAPEWLDVAESFDENRALNHIGSLTDAELEGRQAGSPGAHLAAEYIAARFAEYGLLPLGDVPGETPEVEEGAIGEGFEAEQTTSEADERFSVNGVSYFQHFPIEYARMLAAPFMQVWTEEGGENVQFSYREDFVLAMNHFASWGEAEAEMVWIWNQPYEEGIDLNGKIAVRVAQGSVAEEIQNAIDHGAGGLILVQRDEFRTQKDMVAKAALPINFADRSNIPIVILGNEGYQKFLDLMDMTPVDVDNLPPALPTGMTAHLSVEMSEPLEVEAVNVLGYIPGSDPVLSREIILVGAHYDHVGDDPDGVICAGVPVAEMAIGDESCERIPGWQYSGANDNAAGVGVLLEIARLWHESGYQPKRTVVFAAWAAQEAGEIGSRFYVEHPAMPLENTVATIQLDSLAGGGGFYLIAQGEREDEGEMIFTIEIANDLLDGRLILPQESARSDQIPFQEAGVPSMLVSWRDASEDNWPDGIANEVEAQRLDVAGRLVTLTLMGMAR